MPTTYVMIFRFFEKRLFLAHLKFLTVSRSRSRTEFHAPELSYTAANWVPAMRLGRTASTISTGLSEFHASGRVSSLSASSTVSWLVAFVTLVQHTTVARKREGRISMDVRLSDLAVKQCLSFDAPFKCINRVPFHRTWQFAWVELLRWIIDQTMAEEGWSWSRTHHASPMLPFSPSTIAVMETASADPTAQDAYLEFQEQ